MKHTRGRLVQITSLTDLDGRLAQGARRLAGWRVSGVDLSNRGQALLERRVAGALFLGCTFAPGEEQALQAAGAIVFPDLPGTPVDPYRHSLYSAEELYDTARYRDSLDARSYAWSQARPSSEDSMAMALHDLAIDQALESWTSQRRLVGVMGGHALERGSPGYAQAAELGRGLGTIATVATGGGPGAMEAANLGAYLAGAPDDALTDALAALSRTPSFRPSVGDWVRTALEVIADHPDGTESLGVPTWHYGHEPPNPFATSIAKYFKNATREAILLEVCNAGIVFLPGAAGTVQEVFQDACENYYADASALAPMILLGREHWTTTLPVWPLLQALAKDRGMAEHVHLVDSVAEAAALVGAPGPLKQPRD